MRSQLEYDLQLQAIEGDDKYTITSKPKNSIKYNIVEYIQIKNHNAR